MTVTSATALILALLVLAMLPGPGIAVVIARTLKGGFVSAWFTSLGIVTGDVVFVLLALLGLAALAEVLGQFFLLVRIAGGCWLIWLGLQLVFRPAPAPGQGAKGEVTSVSRWTDFHAGLLVTLGNPKAIIFYGSFFPNFVDVQSLSLAEVLVVLALVTVVIGGIMMVYAWLVLKGASLMRGRLPVRRARVAAGSLLAGCGTWLIWRH